MVRLKPVTLFRSANQCAVNQKTYGCYKIQLSPLEVVPPPQTASAEMSLVQPQLPTILREFEFPGNRQHGTTEDNLGRVFYPENFRAGVSG